MKYQKILLIDDDEDDQEIFLNALQDISLSTSCAVFGNAREALFKLSSQEITPDLIFLDLNMPLMTGQQFLTEIKKEESLSEIPIVVLSTTSHAGTIELSKQLGANYFFTKPDRFEDLIDILESVLTGHVVPKTL